MMFTLAIELLLGRSSDYFSMPGPDQFSFTGAMMGKLIELVVGDICWATKVLVIGLGENLFEKL